MAMYDAPCCVCGEILPGTPNSLPAGKRTCRPCRAEARAAVRLAQQRLPSARTNLSPPRSRATTCSLCGKPMRTTRAADAPSTCRPCRTLRRGAVAQRDRSHECLGCGSSIHLGRRGRPVKWCTGCRLSRKADYERERRAVRTGRRSDTAPCAGCGKPIKGGRGSLPAGLRVCRSCRSAGSALRGLVKHNRLCKNCGLPFVTSGVSTLTCSQHCAQTLRYTGRAACASVRTGRCCEVCGATYRATWQG